MTGPAGGVQGGGTIALPAKLAGVAGGMVLPATVRALPGRLQYLLQVAGRELPWTTQQKIPDHERVAVLVGDRVASGRSRPGGAPAADREHNQTPARVFRLASVSELLVELKIPDDKNHHAALRALLDGDRPFTADQLRAAARPAAAGRSAPPPRAAGADTAVADLLARGKMTGHPLAREIIAVLRRAGREPAMAQVREVMARALQAGTSGGAELLELAAAGQGFAPVTVDSLLAEWRLPDDALHRNLLLLLLSGRRLPTAETVRELAQRAQQWGAADLPGWRALVRQWQRDLPPVKSVWLRLRAAAGPADRPLAAMAAVAQRVGWSAAPGEFSMAYWSRLGLGVESDLARGTNPSGDNLRGVMLNLAGDVPDAVSAGAWMDGCVLETVSNPNGEAVLPLLFTGAAGPLTGTLTVHERRGGHRAAARRPGVTLALHLTALGAVRVEAVPAGRGYVFTLRGSDPDAAGFIAAAGENLCAAVAACGEFSVRFAGPETGPGPDAPAAGLDVRV